MRTEQLLERLDAEIVRDPAAGRPPLRLRAESRRGQWEPPALRSHATRVLHLLLLTVVLHQLIGSNFVERPLPGDDPEWPYLLHQWIGLAGFALVSAFWLWTLARHPSETRLSKLVPWFSLSQTAAVLRDVWSALRSAAGLKAPPEELDALASAVHGLGLLIMSFMALTGASWYLFFQETSAGKIILNLHKLSANLMWAYLIGHAGIAVLRQLLGGGIFSRMFWPRRRAASRSAASP